MRGTGLTKVGARSRMGKLNMPVSPPHLVSSSHVQGTEREMKNTVPASSELPPCEVYTWIVHNFSTSVTGLLGKRHELMCAKCLKQCRAGGSMCSIDVIYYYYLAFCIALCCSIVYKALWHFLYKASGFYTFSKYLSYVNKGSLSAFSVSGSCQAELRNAKNESDWRGRLYLIRLERETPLPHMPTRDREELGQEEGQ